MYVQRRIHKKAAKCPLFLKSRNDNLPKVMEIVFQKCLFGSSGNYCMALMDW